MEIVVKDDARSALEYAARFAVDFVRSETNPILGLGTGNTQLDLYRIFAREYAAGLTFKHVTTFNLDEYIGLPKGSPYSYATYMLQNFVGATDVLEENVHLPDGGAEHPEKEANRYDALIGERGGIGLQMLSIGRNGHIGFNEPGTQFTSRTRVEELQPDTLHANRDFLPTHPPKHAITMGIATILEANRIVLIATGTAKASAIKACITLPATPSCPASALQRHGKTIVVLDRDAAACI
jgi:glucosamine-6-phosphate deaminase